MIVQTMLNLDAPTTWPAELIAVLDGTEDAFLGWEHGRTAAHDYDAAHAAVREALDGESLRGWHCTRLTENEIATIAKTGMALPSPQMLGARIAALLEVGILTEPIAERLLAKNQADDRYRTGMLHFVFFPPHEAGEWGIGRFFRHWGGEALYNSHEDDPVTGPAIAGIGTPCVIEVDVAIAGMRPTCSTVTTVVQRHLASKGHRTSGPFNHEDAIRLPVAADRILAIHRFPEPGFLTLTGCSSWGTPIHTTGLFPHR